MLTLDARTGETNASRRFDHPNHNAALSPEGKEIRTSRMATLGKVLVLDAGTPATKQTLDVGDSPAEVTVGASPHGIAFTQDGKTAYISNQGAGTISIIDIGGQEAKGTVTMGESRTEWSSGRWSASRLRSRRTPKHHL